MSLLFILLREISTLSFCVNGFIVILLLPTDWAGSFFIRNFLCVVADLLAEKISGTGVDFFRYDGKF